MDCNTDLPAFVNALFEGLQTDEVPVLTRPAGKSWHNHVATAAQVARIEAKPDSWYISIATVDPHQEGRLRRDRGHLKAAYAVLCDDVGTKANRSDVPYSYELESSAGNLQCVWFIDPWPLDDEDSRLYYEACVRAIGSACLSDEGAGGAYRVMRVPGSLHKSGFVARVVEWHPERAYALPDLMQALGLEPEYKGTRVTEYDGELPDTIEDVFANWLFETGRLGEFDGTWCRMACPWGHEHSDGNTDAGYSPLGMGEYPLVRGFNCFHQHCAGRGIRDLLNWGAEQGGPACDVSGVREFKRDELKRHADKLSAMQRIELLRLSIPYADRGQLPEVERSSKGAPARVQPVTTANVEKVLQLCGARIRRNMQAHTVECDFHDEHLNALLPGNSDAEARQFVRDRCTLAGMRGVDDVINVLSERMPYSPICDWIDSAPWDGVSRFDDLLATVDVQGDSAQLWPVYLRRWLIQACQAMHNWKGTAMPLEHVLVLVGPQGAYKTTWCASLVPDWAFTRGVYLNLGRGVGGDRDAIRQATATPLVELGELETTFSKSEVGHQKNFLSQAVDRYRMSYGHTEVEFPRTTAYLATANNDEILIDSTGSRRFWVVKVARCDSYHDVDMQQLWAEVKTWWAAGEQWHLSDEDETLRDEMSTQFEFVGSVEEKIAQYLYIHNTDEQPMNVSMFLEMLDLPASNINCVVARGVLSKHLGEKLRCVGDIRNCWLIPTRILPHNHLELLQGGLEPESDKPT